MKDLDGQRVISLRGKRSMAKDIARFCHEAGATPLLGNTTVSSSVAMQLVYEGREILIMDRKYEHKIDTRRAVMIPFDVFNTTMNPPVSIIWRSDLQLTEVHAQLVALLRDKVSARVDEVHNQFDD